MLITYSLGIYLIIFAGLGLISFFNWRKGFFFFLIYIFFEDAIRMKFFHNNVVVQLAKDLLFLGMFAGCFFENRKEFRFFKFLPSIIIFIIYEAINIFNPSNVSLTMGAAALKLSFFYFPLIWISSIYFKEPINLRNYLLTSFTIASIICTIAFIQTITGPDWWWNFFGNYEPLTHFSYHTWTEEPVFRPFGIFNNSGRFMHLLFIYYFYFLLSFTLQGVLFNSALRRYFWLMSIPFFAGFFYSIARTSFIILSLITILYISQMKGITSKEVFKKITINRLALIFTIFSVLFITSSLFRERVQTTLQFLYKSVTPGHKEFEVINRVEGAVFSLKYALNESGLFGHGTGINSLGLVHILGEKYTMKVESGYAAMIWEAGVLGLILWLNLWIAVLKFFFYIKSKVKIFYLSNTNFLVILLIISFLTAYTTGFQTFQSWIFNILLWNFIGIAIGVHLGSEKYLLKK